MLEHLLNKELEPAELEPPTLDDMSETIHDLFEQQTEKRIRYLQSADPDPYGLHKIPIETRLVYMEHYLITRRILTQLIHPQKIKFPPLA